MKKKLGIIIFVFIAFGCNNKKDEHLKFSLDKDKPFLNKDVKAENEEIVKDFEGNKYKIVNVGNQIWTEENLNTSYFNNGEKIPEAKTNEEWEKAATEEKPVWCYYENNISNGKKYGKLYNYYVLQDSRDIAPKGWHIPSYDELELMIDEFGGYKTSGLHLKSDKFWTKCFNGDEGNGTNSSGFNGLPGGYRMDNGDFTLNNFPTINENGYWWSSTKTTDIISIFGKPTIIIGHEGEEDKYGFPLSLINCDNYSSCNNPVRKGFGFSVRFIKDNK